MKAAIISFPGSNRELDAAYALQQVGFSPKIISAHASEDLCAYALIMLPGGFSYGDYLRAGAVAATLPIMRHMHQAADNGCYILGVCNGFQILTETGLLPGALMMNKNQLFVCRQATLLVNNPQSAFSHAYGGQTSLRVPIAHQEGNYYADTQILQQLEAENRIIFRYAQDDNPNGSVADIAGITNVRGNVLGMMPHPENATLPHHHTQDGLGVFASLAQRIAA